MQTKLRLLRFVRGHWGSENGLHDRREVTFQEDGCHLRTDFAAHAMAIFNNWVLGLLPGRGVRNVAEARRAYAANGQ